MTDWELDDDGRLDPVVDARLKATKELLDRYISDSSQVLDVGANDGSFRDIVGRGRWTTVDKFGNPDIRLDIARPDVKLPFADATVDIIVCTEVLEHLVVGSPLVKEFARVLTPEGTAIISVPNIASAKSRIRLALGYMPNGAAAGDCGPPLGGGGSLIEGVWVGGHVVDFNEKRLVAYLERAGLRVKEYGYVPLVFGQVKVRRPRGFVAPRVLPRALLDYVLVAASPI